MSVTYKAPSSKMLNDYKKDNQFSDKQYIQQLAQELVGFFKIYKVKVTVADCKVTPFSVRFDLLPQMGVSIKKIRDLRKELEVCFAAPIEIDIVPDKKHTICLTIKSWERPIIGFKEILESKVFKASQYTLPVAAGMDVLGNPFCFDLAETPNILVAGTTGAGKSMFLNIMILSIMLTKTPEEVNFIMIDPKIVELGQYNGNPFLLGDVVAKPEQAMETLEWVAQGIETRFNLLAENHLKTFNEYNAMVSHKDKMKRILVVIDEYADLVGTKNKEFERIIGLIARNGRATGVHLVLSTQRPYSKVISNGIKASIPCRASFTVIDWRESKAILERTGAERLRGSGDMLFSMSSSSVPTHVQASYISNNEIDRMIDEINRLNFRM